jgi:peptidoglycan/LPS O-acetylase OafA/YrhL
VSVDALRAIAALMVLVSHAVLLGPSEHSGLLAKETPRLGVGVWIFFAASGYLIAGPFLRALLEGRQLPPVRRYALRRAVRILPAYWVALAAILLLVSGSALAHWWQVPVHALLIQGLVPGELKSFFLVAWSLGVEAIFYVLVPLGAWAVVRLVRGRPVPLDRLVVGILGLWSVGIVFSIALAIAVPFHAGRPLPGGVQVLDLVGSLANFCPGMLVFLAVTAGEDHASRWWRRYVAVASRPLPTLAVAALLLLAATQLPFQTSHLATAVQWPLLGVASGLVLATFVHGGWTRRMARVLAPVGLISYGVYLWHWVIVSVLVHNDVHVLSGSGSVATVVRVALLVGLTLPIAALSWLLIERPLLRRTTGWERRSNVRGPTARPPEPRRRPSVSVVIPCYNYGRYLDTCVRSVLDQDGVDVRVLIIDDASSDDSALVAARLAAEDERVEVRAHSANHGHIATYNEGLLEWADGDYSVLISADDLLTPGSLARATDVLEANPGVGFVYGRAAYWRDDEPLPAARVQPKGTTVWRGLEWLQIVCGLAHTPVTSPEVVVRTALQKQIGGYLHELPHTGDAEMWMRFAAHSDVAYVKGADQAYYRMHATNMTTERVPIVDLRQRKAAYDALFAARGDRIPDADRLAGRVHRAMAKEALWRACRAYERRRMDTTPIDELTAFARSAYPRVHRLPEYWGLRWRQMVGPKLCPYLQPIMVSAVHRRLRTMLWWRRWARQGI